MDNNQPSIPNMNQAPTPMPAPNPAPERTDGKAGPIIGIIIVIIVLVVGALYFWGERLNREMVMPAVNQTSSSDTVTAPAQTDPTVTTLKTQSSSDSYSSIQQDLNATSLDGLDSDFQNAANQ